ncbi:MAG TPA: endonuclease III, partial [Acidobacteriota bacterium]|nr:endonuclease III [Acidobacteriota bacterium]
MRKKGRGHVTRETAVAELKQLSENGREMRLAAEQWKQPWQVLISVLLSARTRDETTIRISEEVFQQYPDLESLARANLQDVENRIRPVNYYRTKARRIVACA